MSVADRLAPRRFIEEACVLAGSDDFGDDDSWRDGLERLAQHLQSGVPGQWLLRSPAHLWQLDVLVQEYPDALIVQTHRDPST